MRLIHHVVYESVYLPSIFAVLWQQSPDRWLECLPIRLSNFLNSLPMQPLVRNFGIKCFLHYVSDSELNSGSRANVALVQSSCMPVSLAGQTRRVWMTICRRGEPQLWTRPQHVLGYGRDIAVWHTCGRLALSDSFITLRYVRRDKHRIAQPF